MVSFSSLRQASLVLGLALLALLPLACAGTARSSSPDSSTPGEDRADTPDNGSADPRDELFDRLQQAIAGVQVVSEEGLRRLGTTWEKELAVSRQRFRGAQSALEMYYALISLRNSYHDIHSRLELLGVADAAPTITVPDSQPPVILPLRLRAEFTVDASQPASYVVVGVEPSLATVPLGSTLLAVDGKEVAQVEQELREWHNSSSPELLRQNVALWLTYRQAYSMPAPDPGTTARYAFAHPTTKARFEVDLSWSEISAASTLWANTDSCTAGLDLPPWISTEYGQRQPEFIGINLCVYGTANPAVKIVRWLSFAYEFGDFVSDPYLPSLHERMSYMSYHLSDNELPFYPGSSDLDGEALGSMDEDRMLQFLENKGATKILFDVRDNYGGSYTPLWVRPFARAPFRQLETKVYYRPGLKIQPELLDEAECPGQHAAWAKSYLLQNPEASVSPGYPFICLSQSCDSSDLIIQPVPQPFAAQVAVLAGPACVSSCDDFVATLKDNGLAQVTGMPTCGGDAPVRVPLTLDLDDEPTRATFVLTVGRNTRPNGQILEGNPPLPDVPLYPAPANRANYLEQALAGLGW